MSFSDPFRDDTTSILASAQWQRAVRPLSTAGDAGVPSRQTIGLAWYRSDQWDLLRQAAADQAELAGTHREWANQATRLLAELEPRGVLIHKIPVDVPHMVEWCERQNLTVNARNRSVYTCEQAGDLRLVHSLA